MSSLVILKFTSASERFHNVSVACWLLEDPQGRATIGRIPDLWHERIVAEGEIAATGSNDGNVLLPIDCVADRRGVRYVI